MEKLTIKTGEKEELIDITYEVENIIHKLKIQDGIALVYCPHTTAGLTINENADPSVKADIISGLRSLNLEKLHFLHSEGNSPSHIKASLTGFSQMLIIEKGKPVLGTWQGIIFCEFDGPRTRNVFVKAVKTD